MDELLNSSLVNIAAAIRNRQVNSEQLVRGFLDRIERVNAQLNAVVNLTAENALESARKADRELADGHISGPLHGIPMTIKDSLDTKNVVTTWGTLGRADFVPGVDATCVGRLRDAGAILMGKTNTPEFTLSFQTDNLVYGETRNPWDTARTPGGSSGGAAAIIAAGGSPLDVGTDTGGSVRLPSHFCGIACIKPTTGRIPCTGNALPSSGLIAPLTQPGPMARYVSDLILSLRIMSGPDLIDPHALDAPWRDPYAVSLDSLRIGYHCDNGIKTPHADIVTTVESVARHARDDDFKVTEARPSGIEMAGFLFPRLFTADGGQMLEALLEDCRTAQASPRLEASRQHASVSMSNREFAQLITLWHNYQSSMLSYFNDFDLLVCPVNATTALPLGTDEDLQGYTYTSAYNLTGWPGVIVRAGTDSQGLPIGVQILARPFREDHCLAFALWLEEKLDPFSPPPVHGQMDR
ncbi:MAG: amidase [Pseudomonadales bacterium]